jgi:hypothetical protein
MEQSLFKELVKNSFAKRFTIFDSKAHDYATEDCLSNFKRMARLCTELNVDVRKPEGVALFYNVMKLYRLAILIHKETSPKNESLDDNINDLQNYIDLLRGLLYEKEKETEK